jgi:hypothetical protein
MREVMGLGAFLWWFRAILGGFQGSGGLESADLILRPVLRQESLQVLRFLPLPVGWLRVWWHTQQVLGGGGPW